MRDGESPGGDIFLLRWVLMDRAGIQAAAVLRTCAEALGERVLAVEIAIPPDN